MHTPSQFQEETNVQSPKIYFSQKTFGKPTKNRTEDPSMFELLAWNIHGVQQSNFKKNERFTDPEAAYINMISKQAWISQCQQSYLNFHQNSIEVNEEVFQEVQNYIQGHQSKNKQKQGHLLAQSGLKIKQQIHQHQKIKKNNYLNSNQKRKGSSSIQKTNNQMKQNNQKQNWNQKQKDLRKRPQSVKNISSITSPKVRTIKQIPLHSQPLAAQQSPFNDTNIKKRDQITEQEQEKLIQKFKQTTRWIPNSSFTTYFGKPPFQNYGRGNTKPVDGGLIYGTYLYSHNVYPHRGSNSPSHVQSYPVALMKAKSMGRLIPTQPKTSCKYLQNKVNNEKERQYDGSGAIEAQKNNFQPLQIQTPDLHGVQKFGGTKTNSKTNFYQNSPNNVQGGVYEGNKYSKKRL